MVVNAKISKAGGGNRLTSKYFGPQLHCCLMPAILSFRCAWPISTTAKQSTYRLRQKAIRAAYPVVQRRDSLLPETRGVPLSKTRSWKAVRSGQIGACGITVLDHFVEIGNHDSRHAFAAQHSMAFPHAMYCYGRVKTLEHVAGKNCTKRIGRKSEILTFR